jgi:PAS domain S-box-containing protein
LLRRVAFTGTIADRRAAGWYCVAVLGGLLVPPSVGVLALDAGGVVAWEWQRWLMWWLGDVVGALLVGPLLLAWPQRRLGWSGDPARLAEAVLLAALVAGLGTAVFLEAGRTSMAFLMLPPVVWAALRFGLWTSSLLVLVVAGFAIGGTASGRGPFALPEVASLPLLASFLGTVSLLNLLLAALEAERGAVDQRLRASEERLRLAIDHARMATWEIDLEHGRLLTAGRHQELFGMPTPGDRGTLLAGVPLAERPRVAAALDECVATRGRLNVEFPLVHADGDERWLAFEGEVSTAAGHPRLSGVARDITVRKRAERERDQLQAELLQAQKLKAVGTLAGGIAHDFNNVLSVILGATELARRELPDGHPLHARLAVIGDAGARARDLVRQILAFSRGQEPSSVPVCLPQVIGEVVAFLRATLPSSVMLISDIADACPAVLGDATRLHQVLMNLGTNAWQSLPDQRGAITISAATLTLAAGQSGPCPGMPPGRYLHVRVSDTGLGMDAATQARIFEPFYTTKAVGRGTGLGLAVVHGIIADHQGFIAVASNPGHGSTFHLCLPAVAVAPPAEPTATDTPLSRAPHVLLVDDEELLVDLGRDLLSARGLRVSGFTDPHAALAAVRADPQAFDVVITDLTMPGMTGLELASALHHERADLPIILASGYGGEVSPERARQAGIRHQVDKPAPAGELLRQVLRLTGRPPG